MNENAASHGVWNGWYWRLIAISVGIVVVLEVVGHVVLNYPYSQSAVLGVLIVSYVVVPRAKERRLANAFAAVILMFIISLILQFGFDAQVQQAVKQGQYGTLLQINGMSLLLGLAMAYVYLRLTMWSERKRADMEEKRRQKAVADAPRPIRRVHNKKRKRKK